jgi:diaminohydroxyphosphoribosylaminopyrimidine deaminase / 5-amino-6-(5-phosphoribosylamino)uracil reductase
VAPRLLGTGAGMAALGPFEQLAQGIALRYVDVQQQGVDLRVQAVVDGRDSFIA